jgi:hypothetical protein
MFPILAGGNGTVACSRYAHTVNITHQCVVREKTERFSLMSALRRSISALAGGAIIAGTLIGASSAAMAGPNDNTGGGNNTGGGGGGSDSFNYQCKGNAFYRQEGKKANWPRWYDYANNCDSPGSGDNRYLSTTWKSGVSLATTGDQTLCVPGMLIFRFYGTGASSSPGAWSVSRANQANACSDTNPVYRMWRENPSDAPGGPEDPGSPFKNSSRKVTDQVGQGLKNQVFSWQGEREKDASAGSPKLFTSVSPLLDRTGNCAALMTTNPLADGYNGIKNNVRDPGARATKLNSFRGTILDRINRLRTDGDGKDIGDETAYQILGIDHSQYGIQKDPSTGLVAGVNVRTGQTLSPENFTDIFRAPACTTPLQYVSTVPAEYTNPARVLPAALKANTRVRGVCWIPLRRLSNDGNGGARNYPSIVSSWQAGERFSTHYTNKNYTNAANKKHDRDELIESHLGAGKSEQYLNQYRATMKNWYLANTKKTGNQPAYARYTGGHGAAKDVQDMPAPAYTKSGGGWGRGQSMSRTVGANELRDLSKCRFAQNITSTQASVTPGGPPTFTTDLAISSPTYLRAGGEDWASRPLSYDATVTCKTRCAGVSVTNAQVGAGFGVRTAGGDKGTYTPYNKTVGGAWYLAPFGNTTADGPAGTYRDVNPRFTRATNDKQKMAFTLNPAQAVTDVDYVYPNVVMGALEVTVPWETGVNGQITFDQVTVDTPGKNRYTGLNGGAVSKTNAKAPGPALGDGNTIWEAMYPVGGSISD